MTARPEPLGWSSRRELLVSAAGGIVFATASGRAFANPTEAEVKPPLSGAQFVEHHIPHSWHMIYARDYSGQGPAYVLLHGFPDNLHIYDYVVPLITRTGRRVVVFDFVGFGQSDKPAPSAFHYDFDQQVGDLTAVVEALKLDSFIPVGHDSGGPCATNHALDKPERIAWLCLMNTYYADAPTLRLPELIELFGDPMLK